MEGISIETSLLDIKDGIDKIIASGEPCDVNEVIDKIDLFQQDPEVLDRELNGLIKKLTTGFFQLESDDKKIHIASVFYTLSKVCNVKKTYIHLDANVYLLEHIENAVRTYDSMELSTPVSSKILKWHYLYLAFCWLCVIVKAPLKLSNDSHLLQFIDDSITKHEKVTVLQPLFAEIKAELLVKNQILLHKFCELLHETTNDENVIDYFEMLLIYRILKAIVKSPKQFSIYRDDVGLIELLSWICLYQSDRLLSLERGAILMTKIFPKLLPFFIYHHNIEMIEDIISWYLNNMNSKFSEFRFAIANSYKKVVEQLTITYEDKDILPPLILERLTDTSNILNNSSWDTVDSDRLHTLLLISAFSIDMIYKRLPSQIEEIIVKLIPLASRFQQRSISVIRGNQVRDAANFICWSLARCSLENKNTIENIIFFLLTRSIMDSDYLIRKSANAALQEVLGRHGYKIFDNNTILEFIQLPSFNLEKHLFSNLESIFEITNLNYPSFLSRLLFWLVDFGILDNVDCETTLLCIYGLSHLANKSAEKVLKDFGITTKLKQLLSIASTLSTEKQTRLINLCLHLPSAINLLDVLPILGSISEKVLSSQHKSLSQEDIFLHLTILKFWSVAINESKPVLLTHQDIQLFFSIVRGAQAAISNFSKFQEYTNIIVSQISNLGSSIFCTDDISRLFWTEYKKFIRFDNILACGSLPYVHGEIFINILSEVLPLLSSQAKACIIKSIDDNTQLLKPFIQTKDFMYIMSDFLDDYTVTDQGDIGRHVRMQAVQFYMNNITMFHHIDNVILQKVETSLVRLMAEPSFSIREMSYQLLCKIYSYNEVLESNKSYEYSILIFQKNIFKNDNIDFWKGYCLNGGAIYSTDLQIATAIDEFIKFYTNEGIDEKIKLCNYLAKIIPAAQKILDERIKNKKKSITGGKEYDIVKFTISATIFWRRLIESQLEVPSHFNFNGLFARVYNIHLLNINKVMKTNCIKLFPLIAIAASRSQADNEKHLANNILKKMIILMKRLPTTNNQQSLYKKAYLEGIIQILIYYKADSQVELLQATGDTDYELTKLKDEDILLS